MQTRTFSAFRANAVRQATVEVRVGSKTGPLAADLVDGNGDPLENPFPLPSNGRVDIGAPDGTYWINITGPGFSVWEQAQFLDAQTVIDWQDNLNAALEAALEAANSAANAGGFAEDAEEARDEAVDAASRVIRVDGVSPSLVPWIVSCPDGLPPQILMGSMQGEFTLTIGISDKTKRNVMDGVIEYFDDPSSVKPIIVGINSSNGMKVCALYLDSAGQLGGPSGLDRRLRRSAVSDVIEFTEISNGYVPVAVVGNSALIWANPDGSLGFPALSPRLLEQSKKYIIENLPSYAPLNAPAGVTSPTISDGRTLTRLRAKIAQIKSSVSGVKARIAVFGDSWAGNVPIPLAIKNAAAASIGISGFGCRQVGSGLSMWGETFTATGWNFVDGSDVGITFPYGCGPDGNNIWTDKDDSTITLSGLITTEYKIYHFQHGGTWHYRVDSGSWIKVEDDESGELAITSITGLSAGSHTLYIKTEDNGGVVSIGLITGEDSGAGGVVYKLGNGGLAASQLAGWIDLIPQSLEIISPDVIVLPLGTNDYRSATSTPEVFIATLTDYITMCRSAAPGVGIVLVAPARSSGSGQRSLSLYRDAMLQLSRDLGCEFVSLYDTFDDYTVENSRGMWLDASHLNTSGAYRAVEQIRKLLGV